MAKPPLLWLTRPHEDSVAITSELEAEGITTIISPVMRIENNPLPQIAHAMHQAILITSRHAAGRLFELENLPRSLPVFCVGEATAMVAREAQFTQVIVGNGEAQDLMPLLLAHVPSGARVLYFAGAELRLDFATLLAPAGIHIDKQIVYRAEPCDTVTPALREALNEGRITGAAFYSPRSATLAGELLQREGLADRCESIDAYCLSLSVAEAAGKFGWRALPTCHRPTQAAMRDLIVSRSIKPVI